MLRALQREPETAEAFLAELDSASGLHPALDDAVRSLRHALADASGVEAGARLLVERMALALQAAVLLRSGSPTAAGFCRSRLSGQHGLAMGTLPTDLAFDALIERALP